MLRSPTHPKRLEIIRVITNTGFRTFKGHFYEKNTLQATSSCPSLGVYTCFCMCASFSYFLIWPPKRFREVFLFSCEGMEEMLHHVNFSSRVEG